MRSLQLFIIFRASLSAPRIFIGLSQKLEPPTDIPTFENTTDDDFTLIGETNFRGHGQSNLVYAGLTVTPYLYHRKTGMGKSTLLENMIYSDIQSGKVLLLLIPTGILRKKFWILFRPAVPMMLLFSILPTAITRSLSIS